MTDCGYQAEKAYKADERLAEANDALLAAEALAMDAHDEFLAAELAYEAALTRVVEADTGTPEGLEEYRSAQAEAERARADMGRYGEVLDAAMDSYEMALDEYEEADAEALNEFGMLVECVGEHKFEGNIWR